MPRKGPAPRREVLPDPKYGSRLVAKFINQMMVDGKKSVSEKILYAVMDEVARRLEMEPLKAFEQIVDKVKPQMEVKSRRVGGATYQVPMEVRPARQEALAIRWLITYARSRGEKGMVQRLTAEFVDAFHERGGAMKKREDTHRMAEANKAFAHYRW
ncbi:30S ribosomal protein S7 [Thermodesulfomicrobium sp. WS]|uniref:30S ribosomal protein S7 n=1 Tax=Thermodesulfomicrobium sp. WS TaxID=3004129 RepID=UPI00248F6ED8|nr:30S ribosomal protein S7 [Thermodesulfomicrobium sp. WS]BDV00094.1 30S ribosomal protein S7 [Thermodesulfomicrobium sp. WS]